MGAPKKRRVSAREMGKSQIATESSARWAELPREIVAMIASHTCVPVEPLPFTCLMHTADPDSCAYRRHEDRSFVSPGAQFSSGQGQPQLAFGRMGHTGSDGVGPLAAGAALAGPTGPPGGAQSGGTDVAPPAWHNVIPGTFRPAIISETALAMRRVCQLWCQVLSEGVRRVLLPGRDSFTLWASHFPNISHLALGCCTDLQVRSPEQAAVSSPRCRGNGAGGDDQPGPGPSSAAATAAAAATASGGRRRSPRAAVVALSTVIRPPPIRNGGCSSTPLKDRSLEAMTSLRNLQVNDSAVHLDLAATCPSLEELVVWTQRPARYGAHPGRGTGFMGPLPGMIAGGGGGGGTAAAPRRHTGGGSAAAASGSVVTRRSALDRTISSLPGLRRLRLSGVDASAARLGSALMELTALTSLRLFQCRLPTFLGAPVRARSGNSNFARELILNLGAKLQDLSLQGCCIRLLPDEVLAGLTGLRMLDLSSNWLHSLPVSVTLLQRLEYLDLQRNSLAALPGGMSALSRLEDLDLSGNCLHRLPDDFGQLTRLTHLHLGGLHGLNMEASGPLLTSLTNLHSLGLSDVDLSTEGPVPNAFGDPLQALVSALGPAGRLRELLLDGCGLETLPACFSTLTALTHLSLMENFDASGLPDAIASLTALEVLRLGYLDLSTPLPGALYDMMSLRELDLEQNFLPYVSPDISKLSNLQVLNLSDSLDPDAAGDAIPWSSIYSLSRLHQLTITGHEPAPRVPRGLGKMAALEFLQMRHVDMQSSVMEELCSHLCNLAYLDLTFCNVVTVPVVITRLSRLTDLQLCDNAITKLPAGFGALTRLTELGLRGNNFLRSLPAGITRLTHLRNLSWTVSHAKPPSAELLSWMALIPELILLGNHGFAEQAKLHGITWPLRNSYW
ncbi:hypothetical protein VaNZ11_002642 [Volvox africanus]|uniref:Disease resistance R13L4/SHOC-2-like LRR domain-containing protein n=1 Tax=Volvox africanus TaxID=51714 RepID=A0ABQ5RSC5_9CHLO|nr:hypothetical protein VaNZ11_002642 [Volvox africanus]